MSEFAEAVSAAVARDMRARVGFIDHMCRRLVSYGLDLGALGLQSVERTGWFQSDPPRLAVYAPDAGAPLGWDDVRAQWERDEEERRVLEFGPADRGAYYRLMERWDVEGWQELTWAWEELVVRDYEIVDRVGDGTAETLHDLAGVIRQFAGLGVVDRVGEGTADILRDLPEVMRHFAGLEEGE